MEKFKLTRNRLGSIFILFFDILFAYSSHFFALWLRFDAKYSAIPKVYISVCLITLTIYAFISVLVFFIFKLYSSIWRYASLIELFRLIITHSLLILINYIITNVIYNAQMPLFYFVFGIIVQFLLSTLIRFSYRILLHFINYLNNRSAKNVLLVGAGNAGQMILRDLNNTRDFKEKCVAIIDDNQNKQNRYVEGVRVIGGRELIEKAVKEYDISKIYLAIANASTKDKKDIINICAKTGCEVKSLPSLSQLEAGKVSISNMKDVAIEDLLGREPISQNLEDVYKYINNKVVLVTGGGGSIGSELCRQIAAHNPKQLIIFDIYENNAYEIQLELKQKYPKLDLVTLIGSVRDSIKLNDLFKKYKPNIVYHAAAHKHVPLMEDSPNEAIKNNTLGTYKTAYAAMMNNAERFVLISTDKAVNPTNVMGCSKRLCEMIIQSFDYMIKHNQVDQIPILSKHLDQELDLETIKKNLKNVKTEFVAVRFGNVLGSNGSVIPLFKKQIQEGGPVTVTHKDIIRYFMTIPEAVQLVLVTTTLAKGGEIFVLDMGEQVKIDDLARNLIRMSGHTPDEDIKIIYTGLRPGEKLYEERLMDEEGLEKTANDKISVARALSFDQNKFLCQLSNLFDDVYKEKKDIRKTLVQMVNTYHPKKTIDEE